MKARNVSASQHPKDAQRRQMTSFAFGIAFFSLLVSVPALASAFTSTPSLSLVAGAFCMALALGCLTLIPILASRNTRAYVAELIQASAHIASAVLFGLLGYILAVSTSINYPSLIVMISVLAALIGFAVNFVDTRNRFRASQAYLKESGKLNDHQLLWDLTVPLRFERITPSSMRYARFANALARWAVAITPLVAQLLAKNMLLTHFASAGLFVASILFALASAGKLAVAAELRLLEDLHGKIIQIPWDRSSRE